MAAVGISPCPPFNNCMIGLPPAVLYDGNTVAWFKHNDMRTIIRDGANLVQYWFDRYNYAVGANLIPVFDFVPGAWVPGGTAAKIDANTFTTAAGAGFLANAGIGTAASTTYHLQMSVVVTNGTPLILYDQAGGNAIYNVNGTGAVQNVDMYLTTAVGWAGGLRFTLNAAASQLDVNSFSMTAIAGNHLIQQTGLNKPVWSAVNGLLFDGANDYLRTLTFAFVQPSFLYFVGRQITWTSDDKFCDGFVNQSLRIEQTNGGVSPQLRLDAGIASASKVDLVLNTFGIVRGLFNGAGSSFQINRGVITNGNFGANNANGFTLGCRGNIATFGNIQAKEIILRRSADNVNVQNSIYNYLATANGLP